MMNMDFNTIFLLANNISHFFILVINNFYGTRHRVGINLGSENSIQCRLEAVRKTSKSQAIDQCRGFCEHYSLICFSVGSAIKASVNLFC